MTTVDQPTAAPTRKVSAVGIGGAISIIFIYLVGAVFNVELPSEVASALTLIISFLSGYLVKEDA